MPQIEDINDATFMAPYVLTPGQYYDGRRNDGAMLPIKQLMRAVLEDALRCWEFCASGRTTQHRISFAETEAWFFEPSSDGPFAFTTVCETLGIEPGSLRKALRKWRRQQLSGAGPRILLKRSSGGRSGTISPAALDGRRDRGKARANN